MFRRFLSSLFCLAPLFVHAAEADLSQSRITPWYLDSADAPRRDTIEAELTLARRFGNGHFAYATYQPEIQNRDKGTVWFLGYGRQMSLGRDPQFL